jgi:hypothetical protein
MVPASIVAGLLKDALAADGSSLWRARGRSMRSSIGDGELVRLVAPAPARLTEGDVVLALLPHDQLVLHRIVRADDQRLVLRGDAQHRSDPAIARDAVIAVADPTPVPSRLARAYRLVP